MALPVVGSLYYGGKVNGQVVWTQPGGPGTQVFPLPPSLYPSVYQGFPQSVFAYQGLYSWPYCGHWINEPEIITQYDPTNDVQAAILVCPVCGTVGYIVEPADQWWESWYGAYSTGLAIATLPTRNE
jgi:hypothetical protein